ncbi:MAG: hypothetical protein Q9P14_04475 [candidate division KSB1 bacterium]|nr:hypothetical protein [candidate division KSB1 bacterium]
MAEQLKLVAVGGLGLMLSPAATHLMGDDSPAKFVRVHDRGTATSAGSGRARPGGSTARSWFPPLTIWWAMAALTAP